MTREKNYEINVIRTQSDTGAQAEKAKATR